ncbi:hypothetical protein BS17DRAFT_768642 [Gyrodon lividus]|nr:hypothetical protein BS17DRAFT_768642 [Gyrodon lividus]
MSTINIDDCTPTFTVTPSYESPRVIENIVLTLHHPKAGKVGEIEASNIHRFNAGDKLLYALDAESDDLLQFGSTVVDKRGFFRPWLIENEYHKGTGCWGAEMDKNRGPILYISEVTIINPELRGKGIGSAMLRLLINSQHLRNNGFAVCWPVPDADFRCECDSEVKFKTEQERVSHYFRINRFRRIGRTQFFAYSPDPSHPSRHLPAEDDIDLQPNPWEVQMPSSFDPFHPPESEVLPALHTALARNKTPLVAEIIRAAYAVDPASLSAQDKHVRALLSFGVQEDLFKRDNAEYMTPLEECAKKMRSTREFSETLIGDWNGYPDESLLIKASLKRAMGHEMPSTDEEYIKQRKYGCSCGSCVAGWLSPRMQFRLRADADFVHDAASLNVAAVRPHEVLTSLEASTEMSLHYIPRHFFPDLDKTFFKGYIMVFQAISTVLGRSGPQRGDANNHLFTCIPTPVAVLTCVTLQSDDTFDYFDKQAVISYLQQGGRVEYALDAITHRSKDMSPLGDGEFDAIWDDAATSEPHDEGFDAGKFWGSLPHCKNDLEFDMVRQKLEMNPRARWGPYDVEDEQMGSFGYFEEEEEEI